MLTTSTPMFGCSVVASKKKWAQCKREKDATLGFLRVL